MIHYGNCDKTVINNQAHNSYLNRNSEILVTAVPLKRQTTTETDSDTGGTRDHAVSGRKSVIN